jgi:acetyl-CoA acetyltransferase
LKPLARIVDYSYVGVEPEVMGMGPVPAIQDVLKRQGLKLSDIDLFEINEAFAAQYLGVERGLGSSGIG